MRLMKRRRKKEKGEKEKKLNQWAPHNSFNAYASLPQSQLSFSQIATTGRMNIQNKFI